MDNILELQNIYFPSWCFNKVLSPKELKDYEFYECIKDVIENISIKDVIGTTHEKYMGKVWLEMLCCLKRKHDTANKEKIKLWIKETQNTIFVAEYAGKYYILDGNHRICYAKFLGIERLTCNVSKYRLNGTDKNLCKDLSLCGFSYEYNANNHSFANTILFENHTIFFRNNLDREAMRNSLRKLITIYQNTKDDLIFFEKVVFYIKYHIFKQPLIRRHRFEDNSFQKDLKNILLEKHYKSNFLHPIL